MINVFLIFINLLISSKNILLYVIAITQPTILALNIPIKGSEITSEATFRFKKYETLNLYRPNSLIYETILLR